MTSTNDPGSRKALGRGLAALIPPAPANPATTTSGSGLRSLALERIHPNQSQPRKYFDEDALDELADSIRNRGVLQPVVVRRRGDEYELVVGERRWRAAGRAGLHEIPALVQEYSDVDAFQAALVENIQREDLDPLEEAEAYTRLIREYGYTQEQVAEGVGKSRAAVANTIRLLKLPEVVIEMLADRRLTAGHARAIMTLDHDHDKVKLANDAVKRGSTVREIERRARMIRRSIRRANQPSRSPSEVNVEERLQRALGTKVRLHHRKGKGKIEVFFYNLEQLDSILNTISP